MMLQHRRIHVLHVLNSSSGGSAISTFELINALTKKGITSSLVCFNNAKPDQVRYIQNLVEGRVLFIPLYWMNKRIRATWWKRPLIELKALWDTWRGHKHQEKIQDFIQRHGVTLIHTSTIVNPEGAIAAKKSKLPHVWHVRELIGPDKHFQFYNFRHWSRWVSNNCDLLVANSASTGQCLARYFQSDKINVTPNGIDVRLFNLKMHTDDKRVIVGMVGSPMSRWKNHAFFIEVAAFLKAHDIEFRIYGALPVDNDVYYATLRDLVRKKGVEDCVKFVGKMDPSAIMTEIDVLFHPTHLESFGRVFIEAMAGGIPIVAIDEGGALETVRDNDNGLLVARNNVLAAANAILRLSIDRSLRNTFGANGRRLAEERFSLDILSERMIDVYNRVLQKY